MNRCQMLHIRLLLLPISKTNSVIRFELGIVMNPNDGHLIDTLGQSIEGLLTLEKLNFPRARTSDFGSTREFHRILKDVKLLVLSRG